MTFTEYGAPLAGGTPRFTVLVDPAYRSVAETTFFLLLAVYVKTALVAGADLGIREARLVDHRTSGDVSGDWNEVVGYASSAYKDPNDSAVSRTAGSAVADLALEWLPVENLSLRAGYLRSLGVDPLAAVYFSDRVGGGVKVREAGAARTARSGAASQRGTWRPYAGEPFGCEPDASTTASRPPRASCQTRVGSE